MYCSKIIEKTPFYDLGERTVEYDLDVLHDMSWEEGMRCAWFNIFDKVMLVCTDGEKIRVAYRIRC